MDCVSFYEIISCFLISKISLQVKISAFSLLKKASVGGSIGFSIYSKAEKDIFYKLKYSINSSGGFF